MKWQYLDDQKQPEVGAPVLGPDGTVYAYFINRPPDGLSYFVALDPTSGAVKWQSSTSLDLISSPVISDDDLIFFGSVEESVFGLSAQTGQFLWGNGDVVETDGQGAISPNGLYYFSGAGEVYAVNDSGLTQWSFQTGGVSDSNPAIAANGAVIVGGNDGCIYALEGGSGTLLWKETLGGTVNGVSIGSDGTIYASSTNSTLSALDGASGKKKWQLNLPAKPTSPVIASDGTLYVVAGGSLIAVR